jgi:hypothetical protein
MSLLPPGTIALAAILVVGLSAVVRAMRERRSRALADRADTDALRTHVEAMEARVVALEERLDVSEQQMARLAKQLGVPRLESPRQ